MVILGNYVKLKQLSGGSINYTKSIKRQAKICLNNLQSKKYEQEDPALQSVWQPFINALKQTKSLPDGGVQRGLLAFYDGTDFQNADLLDLAAGICNCLFLKEK